MLFGLECNENSRHALHLATSFCEKFQAWTRCPTNTLRPLLALCIWCPSLRMRNRQQQETGLPSIHQLDHTIFIVHARNVPVIKLSCLVKVSHVCVDIRNSAESICVPESIIDLVGDCQHPLQMADG